MAISATTSATTTTQQNNASPAAPQNATMDKNAFLKLLVAQMQNQDPLQPMQGTEFVTQLAQFSIVEQSQAQSSKLDLLSQQMTGLSNNETSSLIGKTVSIHGHGIAWDGTNATNASVTLQGQAAKVTVAIQDAQGNTVRTMDLGARTQGGMNVTWDGRTDAGAPAPAGTYSMQVTASAADGSAVSVSQDVSGVVQKLTFDQGYPQLVLDSGAMAPVSDLVSVGAPPPANK